MKRRDLLRSILVLPALGLAKFLPKPATPPVMTLLDWAKAQEPKLLPVVEALNSDQTSIWLVNWDEKEPPRGVMYPGPGLDYRHLSRPVILDKAYIEKMIDKYSQDLG